MSKWDYEGCAIRPGTEASKKRKARRKREKNRARFGGEKRKAYAHTLPCCVSGTRHVEAAHLDHAGMGGTDRDCHTANIVPLGRSLHVELDQVLGLKDFERRWGVKLHGIAAVVEMGFKHNWPPEKVRAQWKVYGGR